MPKSSAKELAALREQVYEAAGGRCEWPGCASAGEQMAHIEHRGMGGSRTRNNIDNVLWLCVHHHDVFDGRTRLRRWELSELLRITVIRRRSYR